MKLVVLSVKCLHQNCHMSRDSNIDMCSSSARIHETHFDVLSVVSEGGDAGHDVETGFSK